MVAGTVVLLLARTVLNDAMGLGEHGHAMYWDFAEAASLGALSDPVKCFSKKYWPFPNFGFGVWLAAPIAEGRTRRHELSTATMRWSRSFCLVISPLQAARDRRQQQALAACQ